MDRYQAFVLIAALTVLVPGPAVVMTLSNALQGSTMTWFTGVAGMLVGNLCVATLAAFSVGVALHPVAHGTLVARWLGAGFLVYLGYRLWRAPPVLALASESRPSTARRCLAQGLLLPFFNPYSLGFFFTVFTRFMNGNDGFATQFMALIAIYLAMLAAIHGAYALFAGHARRWLTSPARVRAVRRLAALCYWLFGLGLLA